MKDLLKQYAAYNAWANQRLFDVIMPLTADQQQALVASSFPSLQATILHIWDAESIWWQRIKLQETITIPSSTANLTFDEIANGLRYQDKQWIDWISLATTAALEHVFAYQNSKKEQFKQPVFQVLMQVFNHATYHRGQLVTILHQLGVTKIPSTDFIVWSRTINSTRL